MPPPRAIRGGDGQCKCGPNTNQWVQAFGRDVSRYRYDVLQFLSYGTERKPFQSAPWPGLAVS